jgi:osmoprotectant transport system permease protein
MLGFLQVEFAPKEEQTGLIDWEWLADNFTEDVVPAFLQHIFLCLVSLAIALIISLPLGILAARYRWLYPPLTAITGFFYTIPSFSMFALMIFVIGLSVGRTPAIIALVLYSLLVLIRNVVTGLDSVPPETKDAARGMGLTDRQILWRVELPLALPVIVAGLRIAFVTVIGIAVIGAYINAGGLGDLIFDGITRDFPTMYITGAILATLLAVGADLLFVGAERLLSPWARRARGAT